MWWRPLPHRLVQRPLHEFSRGRTVLHRRGPGWLQDLAGRPPGRFSGRGSGLRGPGSDAPPHSHPLQCPDRPPRSGERMGAPCAGPPQSHPGRRCAACARYHGRQRTFHRPVCGMAAGASRGVWPNRRPPQDIVVVAQRGRSGAQECGLRPVPGAGGQPCLAGQVDAQGDADFPGGHLQHDGSLWQWRTWRSAARHLLGREGLFTVSFRPWRRYFRPDFHPGQDESALAERWLQDNAARFKLVGAR